MNLIKLNVRITYNIVDKKLAVFDLDETLVHCKKTDIKFADVALDIKLESGKVIKVGINIRPHIIESLQKIQESKYDIICYTASQSQYADVVLDFIEKEHKIFSKRLYRQNCIKTKMGKESTYVKDLRIFHQVDLRDIIIIDNSALSFATHLDNGIPILPFYDNKNDNELLILANYLKEIANAEDIRQVNKKFMKYDNSYCSSASEDEGKYQSNPSYSYLSTQNEKENVLITENSYISDNDLEFSYFNIETERDRDQLRLSVIKKNYSDFQSSFQV
ncbi:MAG: HAD family hydrolase [bacterium]|nr:HAD family hydrolase [bacterium]